MADLELVVQTGAQVHDAVLRSSINDERRPGTFREKLKTLKSRLFREEYSRAFENSDTSRWTFQSAGRSETSDLEWEALRSFDCSYRPEIVSSEADKLVSLKIGPNRVKELIRKWTDKSESVPWIWEEVENAAGHIYLGDSPKLKVEEDVVFSLQLSGEPVWEYLYALQSVLSNTRDGTPLGVNADGYVGPVGDDIDFLDFQKFWKFDPSTKWSRIMSVIFRSVEPKVSARTQWAEREGFQRACKLRRICNGQIQLFETPSSFQEYLREYESLSCPRLLVFNTRSHSHQQYFEFVSHREALDAGGEIIIGCYGDILMAIAETDTCWLAVQFRSPGDLPTKFPRLEDIAIDEIASDAELVQIKDIVQWTRVARKAAEKVISGYGEAKTVTRAMLGEFSIYQAMEKESQIMFSRYEGDLSNISKKDLIIEFLSGNYLGLGLACEMFEESRPRLERDLRREMEMRIQNKEDRRSRSQFRNEMESWSYGGEELWLCELARSMRVREKTLPKLMVHMLKRSYSRVTFGRDSAAFLNAENGIVKVWYNEAKVSSVYEVASPMSDTSVEAYIATIYIGSTLRPQLRLSGGLELVPDDAATLKMIGAASEGLPKFAGQARETISENIRSKRGLWNKFEIKFTDVLKFIQEVSHNIGSSRDAAFVKRETLVLLGNEGIRPTPGNRTCLFDVCCETRFTPTAIVGEAAISGEGVAIYKFDNNEYVKIGDGGQIAAMTRDENGFIHLSTCSQELATKICFDRFLDSRSEIGMS